MAGSDFVNHQNNPKDIENMTAQRAFADKWKILDPNANVTLVPSIQEAIGKVRSLAQTLDGEHTAQAMITGSLHLVGGALGILEGASAM